jgi:uncharacterized protein YfaQ (DUF2300 family)
MSYNLGRISHGAHQTYFDHPHDMHTDPYLDHRAQQGQSLDQSHVDSARYARRHHVRSSESTPATKKKMWAIFFMALLTSNVSTPLYSPNLTGGQGQKPAGGSAGSRRHKGANRPDV